MKDFGFIVLCILIVIGVIRLLMSYTVGVVKFWLTIAAVLFLGLIWFKPLDNPLPEIVHAAEVAVPFVGPSSKAAVTTQTTEKPVVNTTPLVTTTEEEPPEDPPAPVSCDKIVTGVSHKTSHGKWRLVKVHQRDGYKFKRYKKLVMRTTIRHWKLPTSCPDTPKSGQQVIATERSYRHRTKKSKIYQPQPAPPQPTPSPPTPAPTPQPPPNNCPPPAPNAPPCPGPAYP